MPNYYRCQHCFTTCDGFRIPWRDPCPSCNKTGAIPDTMANVVSHVEIEHANRTVNFFDGDKRKAAECLEVSLATLYRKLKGWKGVAG